MSAAAPTPLARRRAALRAIPLLLASATLAAAAALAADPASAARPAARTLAQQSASTLYGVEMIVFRASSVVATEDWDAEPAGRGFGTSAARAAPPPRW